MANGNNGNGSKTVITDERQTELPGLGLRITLRKPADQEDRANNLIFVQVEEFSPVLDTYRTIASTRAIIGRPPVDLLPARVQEVDEEGNPTGRWVTDPKYPQALRYGALRSEIESAIAKALGAKMEITNPMNGNIEAAEEAEEAVA